MEKTYAINGKTYVQRPLVLGQAAQLLALLKGVTLPGEATALGLVAALGERIPDALAIVLTEEGMSPRDKNLSALAEELAFFLPPETALEAVDHFFELNPLSSWLSRLAELMTRIGTGTKSTATPGSTSSVSS